MTLSQLFVLAIVLAMTANFVECQTKNVALTKNGAKCRASSKQNDNYGCEKAIDGLNFPRTNEWASDGEGVGAWLEITFKEAYTLLYARIMQRLHSTEQSETVRLEFDWAGQNTDIKLTEVKGKSHDDTSAAVWDVFELKGVCTQRVRMDVLTVHSSGNNGFIEVQFFANETCSLECNPSTTPPAEDKKVSEE